MGLSDPRIFLDSCIAIYIVEEHPAFAPKIELLLDTRPDAELQISELAVMECLVGPMRSGNQKLENKFRNWFADVFVLPVTNVVFENAARLRADHPQLKTPDAIHLGSAIHYKCDEFWTNDERLSKLGIGIVRNIL